MYEDFAALNKAFGLEPMEPVWIDDTDIEMVSSWSLNFPPEIREQLSIQKRGENNPMYGMTGEKNPFYGCKHTEETKQMMREHHHDVSGENNPRYGVKLSQEQIQKCRETRCKNKYLFTRPDGSQFVDISISNVAKDNKLGHSNLYQVLKGKYKQHKGWKVEYYEQGGLV